MINRASSSPAYRGAPAAPRRSIVGDLMGEILTDITQLVGALADPADLVKKSGKKDIW